MRLNSWWTTEETAKQWLRAMDLEFKDFQDFTKKYGMPFSEKPEHIAVFVTVNHFDAMGISSERKDDRLRVSEAPTHCSNLGKSEACCGRVKKTI